MEIDERWKEQVGWIAEVWFAASTESCSGSLGTITPVNAFNAPIAQRNVRCARELRDRINNPKRSEIPRHPVAHGS